MEFYILFWICIIGLCLGSFFNVVIRRSLSVESIVFPPSKCPKCQHKLFWWHNIPILSYIILRGKCYFCREKISIQYPIIEFLTMIIFAASYLKFGFSWKCLFVIFWLSCFLIMTMTDLREKVADCNIAIIAALSGILYNFLQTGGNGIISSVLGLIAGAIVLEAIARSGCLLVGTRAMGEADTYAAGALGAIFGLQNIRSLNREKIRFFVIGISIIFIEFTMNTSFFMTEIGADLNGIFLSLVAATVPTALLIAETYILSRTNYELFVCDSLISKLDRK